MNDSLSMYANNEKVSSISGYVYPIVFKKKFNTFFIKGADCWGWGTWLRSWKNFEKDGNKRVVTIDLGNNGQDHFTANKIFIMTILILLYQDGMENYNETIPPIIFTYIEYFRRNKVLVLNYDNENYEWK